MQLKCQNKTSIKINVLRLHHDPRFMFGLKTPITHYSNDNHTNE